MSGRQFYGLSVHQYPDCSGYKSRDKRVPVLSSGARTVGFALNLLRPTETADQKRNDVSWLQNCSVLSEQKVQ